MVQVKARRAHIEAPMAQIEVSQPQYSLVQPQIAMSDTTMQEFQQFQACKLEMSKNLVPTQSQTQAQSFVDLTEPQEKTGISGEVISKPRRSTSVKRSRSQGSDRVQPVAKRAKSATTTSQRSLSPRRDYPRGTCTITKPRETRVSSTIIKTSTATKPASTVTKPASVEDRPVQAQVLTNFKTDMTSLIKDMIQSSLSSFASQFNANSGSKGGTSQDQAPAISRDADLESGRDQADQMDPPVGRRLIF